jgi:hypothetical protein
MTRISAILCTTRAWVATKHTGRLSTKKFALGNAPLVESMESRVPVRVIRGSRRLRPFSPPASLR